MKTKDERRRIGDAVERVVTVATTLVIVGGAAWCQLRETPAHTAAICRDEYRSARNVRDTAMIDEQRVGPRPGWTCGELRRAGSTAAGAEDRSSRR